MPRAPAFVGLPTFTICLRCNRCKSRISIMHKAAGLQSSLARTPPAIAPGTSFTIARTQVPIASGAGEGHMLGTSTLLETPLAAVRTVETFPRFLPPVPPSTSANQQRQVSAARHRQGSQGGRRSADQLSSPSTSIPSRKGKRTTLPVEPPKLKCAIIPFAVSLSVQCNL